MFKVGQKVWCLIYGQGVVTKVDDVCYAEMYSVFAKFQKEDEHNVTYTADGRFHNQGNIVLFPHPVEVTKTTVKPSIDWSHVSKDFQYLAEDADGGVFLYEDKPFTDTEAWTVGNGELAEAHGLVSYTKGTCNWKESLIKRPEGETP